MMITKLQRVVPLFFIINYIQCQKFIVLNDIHFAPNLTETLHCNWGSCTDLGVKGNHTDSPLALITYVLDQVPKTIGEIDGVIITGDFVRHDYYYCGPWKYDNNSKLCNGVTKDHKFSEIKAIWKNVTNLIQSKFPKVPIIPTFGNNDNMDDYGPPLHTVYDATTNPYS